MFDLLYNLALLSYDVKMKTMNAGGIIVPFTILTKGFAAKLSALRKWLSLASISKEQHMVESIPALPQSDEEPSFAEMATWLLKALPPSDRPEAYTLLVTQLLPTPTFGRSIALGTYRSSLTLAVPVPASLPLRWVSWLSFSMP